MPRDTALQVDPKKLRTVLKSIGKDSSTRREFLSRGHPQNLIRLRGGHSGVALRTEEVLSCIHDQEDWHVSDDFATDVVARAVYHQLHDKWSVERVASELKSRLSFQLFRYHVAAEVLGLERIAAPIDVGGPKIGLLSHLASEAGLTVNGETVSGTDIDPAATLAAVVTLEAPDERRAIAASVRLLQQALDVLATSHLRQAHRSGPPWEIDIGKHFWIWPEGQRASGTWMHNPWHRGWRFGVDPQALGPVARPRLLASHAPWVRMPPGDLTDGLRRAYVNVGAALRRAPDARASIALAWSAVETAYSPALERNRDAIAIAVRLQVAVEKAGGTEDPVELANFYLHRNDIVHHAQPASWDLEEAEKWLGMVYRHLDELADFCIARGVGTRSALEAILDNPDTRRRTVEWAQGWREDAVWWRDNAVLDETRKEGARAVKLWGRILEILGESTAPPPRTTMLRVVLDSLRRHARWIR